MLPMANDYIYHYVVPGDPNSPDPYVVTTNGGSKVIFKAPEGNVYVASVPTADGFSRRRSTAISSTYPRCCPLSPSCGAQYTITWIFSSQWRWRIAWSHYLMSSAAESLRRLRGRSSNSGLDERNAFYELAEEVSVAPWVEKPLSRHRCSCCDRFGNWPSEQDGALPACTIERIEF